MAVGMSMVIWCSTMRWISHKNNLFLYMAFFKLIVFSRLVTVWACPSQNMLVTCCLSVWKIQSQSITLVFDMNLAPQMTYVYLRGGADKSLARPGRKQATATKLGIYSAYYLRSSIHFLALCSNFCKPLKKNSGCPSNQVSTAAMASASDEKWQPMRCFFSPGNRW